MQQNICVLFDIIHVVCWLILHINIRITTIKSNQEFILYIISCIQKPVVDEAFNLLVFAQ